MNLLKFIMWTLICPKEQIRYAVFCTNSGCFKLCLIYEELNVTYTYADSVKNLGFCFVLFSVKHEGFNSLGSYQFDQGET